VKIQVSFGAKVAASFNSRAKFSTGLLGVKGEEKKKVEVGEDKETRRGGFMDAEAIRAGVFCIELN
jgi:acetamidase/formamidase